MPRPQPTVTITTLKAQKRDLHYWKQQSYDDRIAALEQIRREYHQWKYGAEPRLQRVYSITQLK